MADAVSQGGVNEDGAYAKITAIIPDTTKPSVTIDQAEGQVDPTTDSTVRFFASFTEPVTGFGDAATDVTLSGTADLSATNVTITGGPTGYTVTVTGVAGPGTVVANIPAGAATDLADNPNIASDSTDNEVRVESADTTAPTASPTRSPAANAVGWNNGDVTVTWNWADDTGGSGIDTTKCPLSTRSTGEGAAVQVTADCTDNAGNKGTASVTVKVDKTAPTLTPTVSPNPVLLGGTATASPNAADASSGVSSQSCSPVNTSSVGRFTSTCSATDNAGNTNTANATYVVGVGVASFSPPNKSSIKRGSTIPVKFVVTGADGRPVADSVARSLTVTVGFAGTTTPAVYDPVRKRFQADVKTSSSLAVGSTQVLTVTVRSGTTQVGSTSSTVTIAR